MLERAADVDERGAHRRLSLGNGESKRGDRRLGGKGGMQTCEFGSREGGDSCLGREESTCAVLREGGGWVGAPEDGRGATARVRRRLQPYADLLFL